MAVLTLFPNATGLVNVFTTEIEAKTGPTGVFSTSAGASGLVTNAVSGGTSGWVGYPYGRLQLYLPTGTYTKSCLKLYWLQRVDGTNFETAATDAAPTREADVVFWIKAGTGAQYVTGINNLYPDYKSPRVRLPCNLFKPFLWIPSIGQATPTGTTIKIWTETDNTA